MNEVVVSKYGLLKTLRDNKTKHVQIFNDAMDGVRVQYKAKLEKALAKLEAGKYVDSSVSIVMPTNHEEQYNEVIEMLEMSVEDEITLSRHEFQQYVQDKWITVSEKNMLRSYALSSSNSVLYEGTV